MSTTVGDEIQVVITAKFDEVINGLNKLTDQMKSGSEKMQSQMKTLTSVFALSLTNIQGYLESSLRAIVSFTEKSIEATINFSKEVTKLQRTLDVSSKSAAEYSIAIGDIYGDVEGFLGVMGMFNRQVANGGEAFKKLGISTTDANGNMKRTEDLFVEVMDKIRQLDTWTERNAAGASIFGRSWGEAARYMGLTKEAMEDARKKVEELDLAFTKSEQAVLSQYRAAMNDAGDVMLAFKKKISNEVMPVLTDLTTWFTKGATATFKSPEFTSGIKGAVQGLDTLVTAAKVVIEAFLVMQNTITQVVMNVARAAKSAMKGEWDNVLAMPKQALSTFQNDIRGFQLSFAEHIGNYQARTKERWNPTPSTPEKIGKSPGRSPVHEKQKKEKEIKIEEYSYLPEMKAELEKRKYMESKYREMSKEDEIEYWRQNLHNVKIGSKDYIEILKELNHLKHQKRKEDFDAEISELKYVQDQYKNDADAKIQIQEMITAKMKFVYGERSKQAIESEREEQKLSQERYEKTIQLQNMQMEREKEHKVAMIDMDNDYYQYLYDLGAITYEKLIAKQIEYEAQKYAMERDELEAQLGMDNLTLEQKENLLKKEQELEDKYNLKRQQMREDSVKKQKADMEAFYQPLTEAFTESLHGLLAATTGWGDAMKNIWKGLGRFVDDIIVDMTKKWIGAQLQKLATSAMVFLKQQVMEKATAASTIATTTAVANTQISAAGAVGGANATATAAQTPFIGWSIAIPAGLAVLAGIMALKSHISAAGGFDIPRGVNPMVQLHSEEMVLPSKYADVIRGAAENGGFGGGNITIHAVDADSVKRLLLDNNGAVGQALKRYSRNFGGMR